MCGLDSEVWVATEHREHHHSDRQQVQYLTQDCDLLPMALQHLLEVFGSPERPLGTASSDTPKSSAASLDMLERQDIIYGLLWYPIVYYSIEMFKSWHSCQLAPGSPDGVSWCCCAFSNCCWI